MSADCSRRKGEIDVEAALQACAIDHHGGRQIADNVAAEISPIVMVATNDRSAAESSSRMAGGAPAPAQLVALCLRAARRQARAQSTVDAASAEVPVCPSARATTSA